MKLKLLLSCAVVTVLLLGFTVQALAHGIAQAGDYQLEIGFLNEPIYQSVPNGLDLIVTNTKTNEAINGLEDSLKVEIIHGASKKTLKLAPQDGVDGAYTADVIPTETGDYTWHIFGKINNTPVDVSMTSAPDTFNSVESQDQAFFPAVAPTPASGQASAPVAAGQAQAPAPATVDNSAQTTAATNTAQTALILSGIGAVLGLAGLVVGFMALQAARRPAR